MADYFKRVHEQTATRFWINNVTRSEAQKAIDAGAAETLAIPEIDAFIEKCNC